LSSLPDKRHLAGDAPIAGGQAAVKQPAGTIASVFVLSIPNDTVPAVALGIIGKLLYDPAPGIDNGKFHMAGSLNLIFNCREVIEGFRE
jgi:hypothetical protein